MKYEREENLIKLIFSASNAGKFRFKKRKENVAFGKTFSTREELFDEKAYLEWQIGYDAIVSDVAKGNKETNLTQESFVGDNGKEKYPYELSEILYEAFLAKLLNLNEIDDLCDEINSYTEFIDEKEIEVEETSELLLNGISFAETSIKLPTLFFPQIDGTQIEISIQKQQYASGVQPMIYFCIPFNSFADSEN
nr:R.Pab1 family restriction endonuclease [Pyrinomonadaceae bacterium]